MPVTLGTAFHFRLRIVVDDLPSAAFNSPKRCARTVARKLLSPEASPIVGNNLAESIDYIIECIGFQHGPRAGSAVEELAEIIDGFLVFTLLADDDVNPKPVQSIFIVEISSAAPGVPRLGREIKLGSRVGRVLQVP